MRHRKKGKILGRKIDPRRLLLRNLATSIVLHEQVKTTEAKAKAVRPLVERMITKGKNPTLHARRELLKFFGSEFPVKKILEDLGPKYKTRGGGYLRIVKLGNRLGDGARIVKIEFV